MPVNPIEAQRRRLKRKLADIEDLRTKIAEMEHAASLTSSSEDERTAQPLLESGGGVETRNVVATQPQQSLLNRFEEEPAKSVEILCRIDVKALIIRPSGDKGTGMSKLNATAVCDALVRTVVVDEVEYAPLFTAKRPKNSDVVMSESEQLKSARKRGAMTASRALRYIYDTAYARADDKDSFAKSLGWLDAQSTLVGAATRGCGIACYTEEGLRLCVAARDAAIEHLRAKATLLKQLKAYQPGGVAAH